MSEERKDWPRCPYAGIPKGEWCDGPTAEGLCPPSCSDYTTNAREEKERRLYEALRPDFD